MLDAASQLPRTAPRRRCVILDAGRRLDARRHVDAERPHARDRVGDVVRRQPAGEQHRARRARSPRRRPSRSSGRCRRAAPDRARRAAASSRAGQRRSAGLVASPSGTRLDDRPLDSPRAYDGVSSPCSCTAPSPTSAATPFTCVGRLIHEHADGRRRTAAARATIARARCGSMKRGLSGQNTNPSAPAPSADRRLARPPAA